MTDRIMRKTKKVDYYKGYRLEINEDAKHSHLEQWNETVVITKGNITKVASTLRGEGIRIYHNAIDVAKKMIDSGYVLLQVSDLPRQVVDWRKVNENTDWSDVNSWALNK